MNEKKLPVSAEELRLQDEIIEVGKRMYGRGYVAANDGNISVRYGENAVWTTPTGVSKGYMTREMLVKVDLEGNVLAGTLAPSSELKMHLRVYHENAAIRAVTHAHPVVATSFAVAGVMLDRSILPEAIVNLGDVPVAVYATPGSEGVPDSIAPYCKDYNAVLLANHGALTWGRDLFEAYFRLESLEHYASILLNTDCVLKKCNDLTDRQVGELREMRTQREAQ